MGKEIPGLYCILAEQLTTATMNYLKQSVFPVALEIPSEWLFSQSFRTTLQAAGLMISFSGLEPLLAKHKLRALDTVSGYSYEMFLTHHIVIAFIAGKLQSRLGDPNWIALTFAAEIVCTVVLAVILKWLTRKTSRALKL